MQSVIAWNEDRSKAQTGVLVEETEKGFVVLIRFYNSRLNRWMDVKQTFKFIEGRIA